LNEVPLPHHTPSLSLTSISSKQLPRFHRRIRNGPFPITRFTLFELRQSTRFFIFNEDLPYPHITGDLPPVPYVVGRAFSPSATTILSFGIFSSGFDPKKQVVFFPPSRVRKRFQRPMWTAFDSTFTVLLELSSPNFRQIALALGLPFLPRREDKYSSLPLFDLSAMLVLLSPPFFKSQSSLPFVPIATGYGFS